MLVKLCLTYFYIFSLALAQSSKQEETAMRKDEFLKVFAGYELNKTLSEQNQNLGWPNNKAPYGYSYPYKEVLSFQGMDCGLDFCAAKSKPVPKDCTYIDFRSKLPKIRDQDSVGWCYAYTAADLVSFKMGVEVSPIDIANATEASQDTYMASLKSAFLGATDKVRALDKGVSSMSIPIEASSKRGFCRDDDLPLREKTIVEGRQVLKEYFKLLEKIQNSDQAERTCGFSVNVIQSYFPNLSTTHIQQILKDNSSMPLADRLINASCKNRVIPKEKIQLKIAADKLSPWGKKLESVNQLLESGRPAAIAYLARVYLGENDPNVLANKDGHASSIVGRKWDPSSGKCEYLIRNSFGKSCAFYRFPEKCEEGYIYVPAEVLMKDTHEVSYVQ